MNNELISAGWNRMRDAGEAALAYPLVQHLPKVKQWAATGAGLAIAKRGSKVAVGAVRKHPLLAIAGAVALAGVGLAVMATRKREAASRDGNGEARPRRLQAKDMRGAKATRSRSGAGKSRSRSSSSSSED